MLEIRRLKITFCLLFLFLINLGYGQYFNVETYTLQDGIPDAVVYDVVQDSSGLMWFAGRSGIFTYDGEKFESIHVNDFIQKGDSFVKLLLDETNSIWFLPQFASKSIVCYKKGDWKKLPAIVDDVREFSFIDLSVEYYKSKPFVVVSTLEHIWTFDNENWVLIKPKDGDFAPINSVESFNDQFYLATKKGVYTLKNNFINPWKTVNKFLSNKEVLYIKVIDEDKQGFPTFGILGVNWLVIYKNKEFQKFPVYFELPQKTYRMSTFLSFDKKDRIYFGNQIVTFVYSRSLNRILKLDAQTGFTTNGATSAFRDRENNLWIASLRGINKIPFSPFINYTKNSGFVESEVASIKFFNDNIFLGHNNGYSIIYPDNVIYSKQLQTASDEIGFFNRILDAETDSDKNIWVVSGQKGLGKLDKGNQKLHWFDIDKKKDYTTLIFKQNNELLIGTSRGVYRFSDSQLERIDNLRQLDNVYVRKIIENSEGGIYICTNMHGLFEYNGDLFKQYSTGNEKVDNVFSALKYKNTIYVGTISGLYIIQDDTLKKFRSNKFQINHPVYFIINDKDGNIWFGLDNGVIKWDGQNHKHYSVEEGLAGYETNRSAAAVDDLGRVWIGTDKGLSIYLKDYDQIEIPAPKLEFLYLEDIDGISHNPAKKIFLGSSQNYFTVHFRALSFIDEKSTKYHVSILNVDNSQIDSFTTVERWARFSNIASGEYQLQIQAENVRGILSPKLTSALITIDSPYYQKAWFIIFAGLFLTGIIFFSVRFYTQRKRSQELEKMVNERTRSLEESKKQLVESERRYKGLIESQNEMIVRVDNQNRFTFVNDAYCRKFAKTREELIGNTFLPLIHPEDVTRTIEEMKYLDTPPYRIYVEQRAMTKDGWRWISWEDYAIKDENGNTVEIQAIGRDITDKKYSDKIKTQAIFDAIEKERSRISRDLHDDLGQILTGAKLKLEIAKKRSNFSETDKDGYNDAVKMLSSVGKHLRNIVHDLHPAEIERYGIFLALESLVFQIQKLTGIEIHYNYSGFNGNWNKNNDLTIYRIVQEALNNVVKHSKATEASISITGNSDEFEITVQDNGIGFDVKKTSSMKQVKRGFGLVNIQQRVELIGGRLKITSKPYEGTTLKVKFLKEVIIE